MGLVFIVCKCWLLFFSEWDKVIQRFCYGAVNKVHMVAGESCLVKSCLVWADKVILYYVKFSCYHIFLRIAHMEDLKN